MQSIPGSRGIEATYAAADSLARLEERRFVPPIEIAGLYALVRDTGRTLDWLERALDRREPNLPYIKVASQWHFLRGTPRFEALREALHLSR